MLRSLLSQKIRLSQAAAASEIISPYLTEPINESDIENLLKNTASTLKSSQQNILNVDGRLLLSSAKNPIRQQTFPESDEFKLAVSGNPTTKIEPSGINQTEALLVYTPIFQSNRVVAVLETIISLDPVKSLVNTIQNAVFLTAIILAPTSLLMAAMIAERSIRPLLELTRTTQGITAASTRETTLTQLDELSQLTLAFNNMSVQLRSQIEALKAERSKLSTVLQQMTDAVVIADINGRIQLFNQSAEKLFLISETLAMGKTLAETLRDHRLVELWETCIQTGEEQAVYLEFRQPNLFLQCIATPMEHNTPGNVLMLFQDLTRVRKLETIRRDFISNISHELRTPLASLKALTETLQDGALDDPPAARRFLSQMETEVDALTHMVSELLELTRIESGKVPLQLRPLKPLDLLIPARERLIVQAERNNLVVRIDCPDDLPYVLADPPRMQQVVVNLFHNAIKFTPPEGEITLGAYLDADQIVFYVKDTGVGIPAEDLPRIFERFYKSDRARSGGGTGLGLAISRHLVEAHGGEIWAESVETRGSTFFFSLLIA
jgi:two-component system, OmpR family, phosphate regulon sensor histidine kinase PhoR